MSMYEVVRVGVAVLLRRGPRTLFGLRKGSHGAGSWSFPGGHLEKGESLERAAQRELEEETGIDLPQSRFMRFNYTNDIFHSEGRHYITLYFTVNLDVVGPEAVLEPKLMEPEKCGAWMWCSTFPSPLFLPIRNLIERVSLTGSSQVFNEVGYDDDYG